MAKVFFFGHGGWDPRGDKTGFTAIPAGTTFKFYTQANTLMTLGFGLKLIQDDPSCGAPDQEFGAFRQCPNMTLYPAPEFHSEVAKAARQSGADVRIANAPVKLSEILDSCKGNEVIWIACRALELADTGRATGTNSVGR